MGKHSKNYVEAVAAVEEATVTPRKVGIRSAILAGATLSVTTGVVAMAATQPGSVAALPVELAAILTPANSTAQIFAGTTYYGTEWTTVERYGEQEVIPFFLGPQGIAAAVSQNSGEPNVILASGWGAGQTGTALGILQANDPEALDSVELVILDNNSNRAGGGFWTTYAPFAPLLLTSAEPTPNDLDVPVLDVAYEYNINSNAPTYPMNPFASANSLVAYVYGYGAQSTAKIPEDLLDPEKQPAPGEQHYHYIVDANGEIVGEPIPVDGNITYVTVKSDGLPLVRPLRSIPGGDVLADAIEPTLTELVNAGYADNEPIPQDPSVPRPMGLLPPAPDQTIQAAVKSTGPQQGLDSLSDSSSTTNPATPTALVNKPKPLFNLTTGNGNMFKPGGTANTSATGGGSDPISSTLKSVSDFNKDLTKAVQKALKPAGADAKDTSDATSGDN